MHDCPLPVTHWSSLCNSRKMLNKVWEFLKCFFISYVFNSSLPPRFTRSRSFILRLLVVHHWPGSSSTSTSSRSTSSSSSWLSSLLRPSYPLVRAPVAPLWPRPSATESSWRWSRGSAACVRRLKLIADQIRAYVSRTACLFYPAGGGHQSHVRLERRPARGLRLWCGTQPSDQ